MGVSGQLHASAALYPGKKTPCTHSTGGLVGPRSGLDTEVRGKILCLGLGSKPDRRSSSPESDTILTELLLLLLKTENIIIENIFKKLPIIFLFQFEILRRLIMI